MSNYELQHAKIAKKDAFYTDFSVIEAELSHYKQYLNGRTIYCNCDDPFESNFFKYFVINFNKLKIKELITTSYRYSEIEDSRPGENKAYKAVVTNVNDTLLLSSRADYDYLFSLEGNSLTTLSGDGDFRSSECLRILDKADIITSNCPFSLFNEYVNVLMEHNKKFIILGNINAITYKSFFPRLKNKDVWVGPSIHSGDRKFYVPNDYPLNATGCGIEEDGRKFIRVKGVRWFTNVGVSNFNKGITLEKNYKNHKDDFPTYDNYNAIHIDKTKNIPYDYTGIMGVPITFMDNYNSEQFEIVGIDHEVKNNRLHEIINPTWQGKLDRGYIKGKRKYSRILIRNKHPHS